MGHGSEAVRKLAHVMVVDQCEGADDGAVRLLGCFLNERFADEVAKRFGAVGVAPLSDVLVELREKVGIDGNADAAKFAHLL